MFAHTQLERLILARALIEDPDHWTQGAEARLANGEGTYASSEKAVCWCGFGAALAANTHPGFLDKFVLEPFVSLPSVNDVFQPCVAHAEVLAVFDRAIDYILNSPNPDHTYYERKR